MSADPRAVGHTRDAGWEIGVSATLDADADEVWELLTGRGLPLWWGTPTDGLPTTTGSTGSTAEGGWFEIRSVRPGEKVRLRWSPTGDPTTATTVQVSVRAAAGDRSRVGFHEERLPDGAARERRREHWRQVLDALVAALGDTRR